MTFITLSAFFFLVAQPFNQQLVMWWCEYLLDWLMVTFGLSPCWLIYHAASACGSAEQQQAKRLRC